MEKRLMSIDDFKRNLCHYCNTYMSDEPCEPGECWVYDVIAQTGSVDAVEVVHGRWLYDSGSGKHFCSACDEFALSFRKDRWAVGELYETFLTDYCPYCGARLDLEVNDA